MAFLPPRFLDDLRLRVSLVSVVGKKVKLTRRGHEYTGLCPFHKEKTPSFTVSEEKGFYHCFGCGAHGDAISFLVNCEKMPFMDAVETLAHMAGMEVPKTSPQQMQRSANQNSLYEVMEKACTFFEQMLYKPEGKEGLNYLHKRGLTDEDIRHFRLGYAPAGNLLRKTLMQQGCAEKDLIALGLVHKATEKGRENYDYFHNRVMFSIADKRKHIIAFGGRVMVKAEPKYLNSPETVLFHKGENLYALPYALETMRQTGKAVLVEGYMDVIALHKIGITNAVAPLGTALTEDQIQILWKTSPEPTICFDGDGAGIRAAERAAKRVLPILKEGYSLKFVFLPDGLDPDDFAKVKGKQAFEALLNTAKPLSWLLWQTLTVGKKFETPEHFAALDKDIQSLLQNIKNATVRGYYEKEFKLELKKFTKEMMYQNKNGARKHAAPTLKVALIPTLTPYLNDAKMLLTYLILFPELYARYMERLSYLKIKDKKVLRLQEILSNELTDNPTINAADFKKLLQEKYSKNLFIYLNQELETLARANKSPEEAKAEFEIKIKALEGNLLDEEIKAQMQEFKANPTPELWTHILSLKQEREKNKENV